MQEVTSWFISTFFNDDTIASVVGPRIFSSPIWDNPQPEYPCLAISHTVSGNPERCFPAESYEVQFSVFSTKGYDECWKVVNKIKELVNRQRGSSGQYNWVCYQGTTPVETSERLERQIYALHVIYDVVVVG